MHHISQPFWNMPCFLGDGQDLSHFFYRSWEKPNENQGLEVPKVPVLTGFWERYKVTVITPLKINMSPEKGPFWKEMSSSNHQFSKC